MKSLARELWFNTKKTREFINITSTIEELVVASTGSKLHFGPWEKIFFTVNSTGAERSACS